MHTPETPERTVTPAEPLRAEERINTYSALPTGDDDETPEGDPPPTEAPMELGDMNEADAIESGYTDATGHATGLAKSHDGTHVGPA